MPEVHLILKPVKITETRRLKGIGMTEYFWKGARRSYLVFLNVVNLSSLVVMTYELSARVSQQTYERAFVFMIDRVVEEK